jgi:hypothetical protein
VAAPVLVGIPCCPRPADRDRAADPPPHSHVRWRFWIGFGPGAGAAAALVLFDSPPGHIERWRTGFDGEKATSRQLAPLVKSGWTLFNDIDTKHGNIDHVIVGPAGVFLLESKRLAGRVKVRSGTLAVSWHEDPEDGYENESIAARARAAAFDLHSRIRIAGPTPWVQPVVVLWADFDQGSTEQEKVAWVRGDKLTAVLAARPPKFSGDRLEQLRTATRTALTGLGDDHVPPSS